MMGIFTIWAATLAILLPGTVTVAYLVDRFGGDTLLGVPWRADQHTATPAAWESELDEDESDVDSSSHSAVPCHSAARIDSRHAASTLVLQGHELGDLAYAEVQAGGNAADVETDDVIEFYELRGQFV